MKLHVFWDASGHGVRAVVYTVMKQTSGMMQGILAVNHPSFGTRSRAYGDQLICERM